MAKKDIPWDLFFERYYPERSLDMTKIHSGQDYAAATEAFFEPIFAVTFDDLQSLTQEELNCLPTSWLYDWCHCHMGEGADFIDKLRYKREQYKTLLCCEQYRKVRAFMKEHNTFSSCEIEAALLLSHEEFFGIAYNLIIEGLVRYREGRYIATD